MTGDARQSRGIYLAYRSVRESIRALKNKGTPISQIGDAFQKGPDDRWRTIVLVNVVQVMQYICLQPALRSLPNASNDVDNQEAQ